MERCWQRRFTVKVVGRGVEERGLARTTAMRDFRMSYHDVIQVDS